MRVRVKLAVAQMAWRCRNCGSDHGESTCDNPDIPVLWEAYSLIDENGEYVTLPEGAELEVVS